jgi:EAL domain-containing protein (putative c-di-GMP-specific phosphodiesterase class I)/putative methionine-R-sulfoxide reductase with GAF domain
VSNNGQDLHGATPNLSDPIPTMNRIAEEALRLIPRAEGSFVLLVDGDELVCVGTAGTTSRADLRLRIDESLSGLAVLSGATLRCDDTEFDPRVDHRLARRERAVSAACVPLQRGTHPLGALAVASSSPGAFGDRDVATLAGLAEFITATITTAFELSSIAAAMLARVDADPVSDDSPDVTAMTRFVDNVLRPDVASDLEAAQRIDEVIAEREFTVFFQPIVDLRSGEPVGVEALARFSHEPYRPPDVWFAEAHRVGRGIELECAAVRTALNRGSQLPPDCYLSVNVGPEAIEAPELLTALDAFDAGRVVVELTEHFQVEDYPQLREATWAIRARGARLAIDDTGSGISSLSHIVKLAPDIIKVDKELIRNVDVDPVRRSLVAAVVAFAPELGATVIAEGIETKGELDVLRHLGVHCGQGYLLGRPGPIETLDAYRVAASVRFR